MQTGMLRHTCSRGPAAFPQLCRRSQGNGLSAVAVDEYRQQQQKRSVRQKERRSCAQRRPPTVCAAVTNNDGTSGADSNPENGSPDSYPVAGPDSEWPSDAELEAAARNETSVVTISGEDPQNRTASEMAANRQQQGTVAVPPSSSTRLLDRVRGGAVGRYAAIGAAGFLALTFVIGVVRAIRKFRSPRAVRVKTVNKNKTLVDTLAKFFPDNRDAFTAGEVRSLKFKTRFSSVEIFRKFLWFLLRERSFDPAALQDTLRLKSALGLSQEQVGDALKERSDRIYKKYGSVMLETEGMTKGGIEKKATCRALFSKLLYLAESEDLLPDLDQKSRDKLVRDVFGATQDDISQLRIISLLNVDADTVDRLASGVAVDDEAELPHDLDDDIPAASP